MTERTVPAARRAPRPGAALALLALAAAAGCTSSKDLEAVSVEHIEAQRQGVADSLRGMGGKLTEKKYPQGRAWSVDLSGVQLPDDLFDRLKKLGHITELNLSKTNVTDAQMPALNEKEIGSLLLQLDLSNTAVTDAGLEKLDGLFLLSDLNLKGTQVTRAGVERFKQARAANPNIQQRFKSPNIRL
jgi:hypothetical protein